MKTSSVFLIFFAFALVAVPTVLAAPDVTTGNGACSVQLLQTSTYTPPEGPIMQYITQTGQCSWSVVNSDQFGNTLDSWGYSTATSGSFCETYPTCGSFVTVH